MKDKRGRGKKIINLYKNIYLIYIYIYIYIYLFTDRSLLWKIIIIIIIMKF